MTQRIGALVRRARARRGLTQEELAGRVGLAVQSLCRIERGRALPSVSTLAALVRELGLPVGPLFGRPEAGGGRREELEGELALLAAELGELGLEIAVAQVRVLAERLEGRPARDGEP
jgi:transcriptional regulator with XRE-family HTH domain